MIAATSGDRRFFTSSGSTVPSSRAGTSTTLKPSSAAVAGIGAVGRFRHEHGRAPVAARFQRRLDRHHAAQLAMGAGLGADRDARHAGQFEQPAAELGDQIEGAGHGGGRLERMDVAEARQPRHLLVEARVVLHGARAQRIDAGVDGVVLLAEAHVVAHRLRLGEAGQIERRACGHDCRVASLSRLRRSSPRRQVNAGDLGAADLEDQRLLDLKPAVGGEGGVAGEVVGVGGRGRAALVVQHQSTSFSAATKAARSASVLISVDATTSRSARSGLSGSSRDTGTPAEHALRGELLDDRRRIAGQAHGELVEERVVEDAYAGNFRKRFSQRHGVGVVERGQVSQARLAEQSHVDGEGQRAKSGVGADVGRRLVAADVLLAGRERQHETAPAFRVDRLAAEAPGHLADELLTRGEQADVGPAEGQRVADRLALAHHDVGALRAGRLDGAQRHHLGEDGDQQRADGVGLLGDGREVDQVAVERRRLDHDAGGLARRSRRGCPRCRSGRAAAPSTVSPAMRVTVSTVPRYCGCRPPDSTAFRRFVTRSAISTASAVAVEPSYMEALATSMAGEVGDLGLELEQVLQRALGDLRLIGRVGGQELGALDEVIDARRHMVAVGAGADEERHRTRRQRCARPWRPARARPRSRSSWSAGRAAPSAACPSGHRRTGRRRRRRRCGRACRRGRRG